MNEPEATLTLLDYRRRVHEMYTAVRTAPPSEATWLAWRRARDELFRTHPQTALDPDNREMFSSLPYFDHDPALRFELEVERVDADATDVGHSGAGSTRFRRFGRVRFDVAGSPAELTLYWLEAYGGGVFVPFRDVTSGTETYGGGRYVLDTVKGADLGSTGGRMVLDFNYAYHPSCVYSDRWSCPLAPAENWLQLSIRAGERLHS